ncbi:MAG: flagellar assembly peptidoglycan hydrolase FlgJ [Pseudomonadota bacterium]|jgi:flagellar protein FlgJ
MIDSTDLSARLALDVQSVGKLRLQAKSNPEQALRGVAQQFEALFMQMMLKSMREATPGDGLLDNEHSRLYLEMLDQQMAQKFSAGKGIGLADMMVRQLARQQGAAPSAALPEAAPAAGKPEGKPVAVPADSGRPVSPNLGMRSFVDKLWPHAAEAGRALGIPPHFLIGQAALESGWGQREIRAADGSASHNLFGIKAGKDWSGAVVEAPTTEYVNGTPRQKLEKFRAYASYAESFQDYAALLRGNPRYAGLFGQTSDAAGFAQALQRAGYATDPLYADKLTRILTGPTLRQALAG